MDNLATKITLIRVALIPILCFMMAVPGGLSAAVVFILFIAAGISDWLDGYIARKYNQATSLGAMLDQISDKLLIVAVLTMLLADNRVDGFNLLPAVVIILREILVAGLREYLASREVLVPVSFAAKSKTALQFVALAFLIIHPFVHEAVFYFGSFMLWVAASLAAYTAYHYVSANSAALGISE
jgi:cardiolipin synthase (CMP-forming)